MSLRTTPHVERAVVLHASLPGIHVRKVSRMKITYKGWLNTKGEDSSYSDQTETIGTTSAVLGLEAIRVTSSDPNVKVRGKFKVSDVVESNGWAQDNEWLGGPGFGHHLEWVELKLEGSAADQYEINYEVHVSGGGWLGIQKNGAKAGAVGNRIQAFRAWITNRN